MNFDMRSWYNIFISKKVNERFWKKIEKEYFTFVTYSRHEFDSG